MENTPTKVSRVLACIATALLLVVLAPIAARAADMDIRGLGQHCWSTVNGRHIWGSPPGAPAFQTYLIDYVHYRYGLSAR